ncbi:MAG: type II toxin-antitoxin system RelE/ParE family toxin [Candidatus Scalindua sp.]
MLKAFKCKETEKIFKGRFSNKLPQNIQRVAERKLIMIHRARELNDLRIPPVNHLEAMKGRRKGQHSIRNDQWRIRFKWHNDGVCHVEITDYH